MTTVNYPISSLRFHFLNVLLSGTAFYVLQIDTESWFNCYIALQLLGYLHFFLILV